MLASVMVEEDGFDQPNLQGLGTVDDVKNLALPLAAGAAVFLLAPKFKKGMSTTERFVGSIATALVVLAVRK